MFKNLIEKHYRYLGSGIFLIFFVYKIENIQNISILYGDDSWVVVGSNYSSILEKLLCCSVTYPGISLLHQLFFSSFTKYNNLSVNCFFYIMRINVIYIIV